MSACKIIKNISIGFHIPLEINDKSNAVFETISLINFIEAKWYKELCERYDQGN